MSSASSGLINSRAAETNSSKFSMRTSPFSPFSCLYISYKPECLMTKSVCANNGISSVSRCRELINSIKRSKAVAARPASLFSCNAKLVACHNVIWCSRVRLRKVSNVRSPMPRGGVLITRSKAASSWRLAIKRKYAKASLISWRSKKRMPP